MALFVTRRLASMAAVLVVLSVVVFILFFAIPGVNPVRGLAGGANATPQSVAAVRVQYGLDKPLPVQYILMMKNLFITGKLLSYANQGERVVPTVLAAAPVTLSLVGGALVLWIIMSIGLGIAGVIWEGTRREVVLTLLAIVALSIPAFWLGQIANLVTQDRLHDTFLFSWVPPPGYISFTQSVGGWFRSLAIPWCVLATSFIGLYSRVIKASILETRQLDYVTLARAKGISERRVMIRHVVRTSLTSYVSLMGLDLGGLIGGGALLVEVVFGLHGVGYLTYQSLTSLDLPTLMATVMFSGIAVVAANAVVDILYAVLDPRVRVA